MAFFLDLSGIVVIAALALLSLTAVPNDGPITTLSSAIVSDAQTQDPQPPQPAPAGSDATAEEKKPPTPPHTGIKALVSGLVEDVRHLPSPQNGYLALRGGGLALAARPVDTSFNQHLRSNYAVASYVAASRLHDNVHYLSDVAFGAAVGVIGGRTVTQHGRQVWTFVPVSVPGGMAIVATRTP